ncbi:MAG: sulfur oxidation c-type cytochrome SoxA [Campylobacteraceae bacterium 4484_166]|nr:MAG: sulfur oxidation c-type cytochrome SoxA [Campylobacteraceae bacterium 4484_166]
MLSKMIKMVIVLAIFAVASNAGKYDKQAQKDRKALIKYFEAKFEDPEKNRNNFFPYSTDKELKENITKGLKHHDFAIGNYAFSKQGKAQYDEIKEMPPYEEFIEKGEAIYKKSKVLQKCFPDTKISGEYPYFDKKKNSVITLSVAINDCVTKAGEKKLNLKKGKIAHIEAYFADQSKQAGKKTNIKINSKKAAEAYDRGKKYYYSQRGYLKLSCASCHVQGAAQRVRNESLSQLLGHTTHFPVYRLKWGAKSKTSDGLGTLERRMAGCIKDEGQVPPKADSKEMKELLYFMAYMSNGMKIDGPDIRK